MPVGISARHVHLSSGGPAGALRQRPRAAAEEGAEQPGQFAAEEQVTSSALRGKLERVRVLGPVRSATQVELAMTDAMKLGIKAPVRMSGDLAGLTGASSSARPGNWSFPRASSSRPGISIWLGPGGGAYGLHDGDRVSVRVQSARPCVWGDVIIRAGKGRPGNAH